MNPLQVQAVLLLLGGCDVPVCAPSTEYLVQPNSGVFLYEVSFPLVFLLR